MNTIKQLLDKYCPDGVEYKKLGEIFNYFSGMTGVSGKWKDTGNCKFIDYLNVYNNMRVDVSALRNATVSNMKQNILRKYDVLLTCASETPDECALSSVIRDDIADNIFLDDHLFALRVKQEYKDILNTAYFNYYFHSIDARRSVNKTVRGVTRFYISYPSFMRIEIPIPPLPVQREIVRILDSFTSLEAELETKLEAELKARRKQYEYYRDQLLSFKHLSAGGKNEVEWKTLGEIGEVCMCKRIMKNQTNAEGCIPFYKIGTFGKKADAFISEELYQEYKQKYSFPRKGEVLISAAGTIGRAVIYDGMPAYFQDANIVWIANDESLVLNKYLYYFYSVADWRLEGGTIKRLYNNNLKAVKIPIPPLSTQRRIVSILDRFESLVNDITTGLPAEITARHQQYEYYRDQLLSFKRKS